jgi:tetratricopeptide (TPR) repeat protein
VPVWAVPVWEEGPSMTTRLVAGGLAVAVPLGVLCLGVDAARARLGLVQSPFGWAGVAVVHLLATLPLAALLGQALSRPVSLPPISWLVLGGCWALLGLFVGPVLGGLAEGMPLAVAAAYRVGWCVLLQLPWTAAIFAIPTTPTDSTPPTVAEPTPPSEPAGRAASGASWWPAVTRLEWALAGAVALLLPTLHASWSAHEEIRAAQDSLERGRLVAAQRTLQALADLGCDELIGDKRPAEWVIILREQLAALARAVEQPLPLRPTLAQKRERAQQLAVLDRLDEAAELLQPLASADVQAAALLAAVEQARGRFAASDTAYRDVLARLGSASLPAEQRDRLAAAAYNGLAYNARAEGRYRQAEAVYLEALQAMPQAAAVFHFQLGKHYHEGGRPAAALPHLRRAIELDAARYAGPAGDLIEQIEQHTPGCLLRFSGTAP